MLVFFFSFSNCFGEKNPKGSFSPVVQYRHVQLILLSLEWCRAALLTAMGERHGNERLSKTDFIFINLYFLCQSCNCRSELLSEHRSADTSGIVFLSMGRNQSIALTEYYTVKPL